MTPATCGTPLRYHVTLGAGFPPADSHVNRMCSDSRGSRDVAFVDKVGTPGFTTQRYDIPLTESQKAEFLRDEREREREEGRSREGKEMRKK